VALFGLGIVTLGFASCAWGLSTTMPSGVDGKAAETMADKMLSAVDERAWDRTKALKWRRSGFAVPVLWDRSRNFVEVFNDEQTRVLLDLDRDRALAFRDDVQLHGDELSSAKKRAFAWFINEAFWLMAPLKVRDDGTARSVVQLDGAPGLLVQYATGGVTPGDAYAWELDDNGRPIAWRMWTQVLPLPGLRFEWTDWRQLQTGAWVDPFRALQ
jgi:hypothetical protein